MLALYCLRHYNQAGFLCVFKNIIEVMILYVDETENQDYFIVAGLLADSKAEIDNSFKHFKNQISKTFISQKYKGKIFLEFKSTHLNRSYKNIKLKMLSEINNLNDKIYYSCYLKKEKDLKQSIKEKEYIRMLEKIVFNITDNIDIIFDSFNKKDFELKITERISLKENVNSVKPMNSQLEAGLKYVDNICGVIRLRLSGKDEYNFYPVIENRVLRVD